MQSKWCGCRADYLQLISVAIRSISFDELARGLSVGHFTGIDEMRHLFHQVDLDGSGALEFSEVISTYVAL